MVALLNNYILIGFKTAEKIDEEFETKIYADSRIRKILFSRTSINDLTLEQMLTYYGIAEVINYLIFDFVDWNLQMHI